MPENRGLTTGCNHLNPPPISKSASPTANPISTPTTPSHKPIHPAPRPRRGLSDRGTPRSSKLQEVFSAADGDEDEEDQGEEAMDVDEQK
jgi:hypothetical protein